MPRARAAAARLPNGLPVLDLFYFLTYLAFFLDGAMATSRYRESYRAMLNPHTFTGGIVADCLQSYAARLGIDLAAVRPLRLLTWLIHSRSEYRQLVAQTGGPPTLATLRGSLFAGLCAEEVCLGQGVAAGLGG